MEKRTDKKTRIRRILLCTGLCVLGLILLNRIVYALILPAIFFHSVYHSDAYETVEKDPAVREIAVETENGTLYGWETGDDPDRVVLYFGGDNIDSSAWISKLKETGFSAFDDAVLITFDYPTFGRSGGSIGEEAFYRAADAFFKYAEQRYPDAKRYLIGYSLGCAAAIKAASDYETDGLILIAPMYDATSVYFPRESFLYYWFGATATVKLPNNTIVPTVEERTLVFAGEEDSMTKEEDIRALCALFHEEPILIVLPDCGHNDYWAREETGEAIRTFLDGSYGEEPCLAEP